MSSLLLRSCRSWQRDNGAALWFIMGPLTVTLWFIMGPLTVTLWFIMGPLTVTLWFTIGPHKCHRQWQWAVDMIA